MKNFNNRSLLALCSLAFALLLTANVSVSYAQQECNSLGAPLATSGDLSATDTAQTLRLFRDGRSSTCSFNRTATTSAGSYNSDQYTFTNSTGSAICVFVDLDATGCGAATNQLSMAAYLTSYNPASILTNLIADPGLSTGANFANSMSFSVPAGATYVIVVHNINAGTTCASYTFKRYVTNNCRVAGFDAANDGSADLAVARTSGGVINWYSLPLTGGPAVSTQFGSAGDIPVPGDYNGDEATDIAVFRPSNGNWYTSTNPATNYGAKQFGQSGDVPVQGDYDRDGNTDLAVYRPSNNTWYVFRSSDSTLLAFTLGQAGDKPVPADYDGDGKTDFAVFRPSNGLWTTVASSGNYGSLNNQILFGNSTDTPVPADYDGDGKSDIAVFRPTEGWYILRSSLTTGQVQFVQFGAAGDIPQPADYDGDKRADEAVFRPSNGTWYLLRSTSGTFAAQFGQSGDQPVTAQNLVQ